MSIQIKNDFFENEFIKKLPHQTQMILIKIMQTYGNEWQKPLNSKTFGELSEDLNEMLITLEKY